MQKKMTMQAVLWLFCTIQLFDNVKTTGPVKGLAKKKLVCYMETWTEPRGPSMSYDVDTLPANVCDYLVVLYVTLDPDTWRLRLFNSYTPIEEAELYRATSTKKKNPNMKVLLSVGGWEDVGDKYSTMLDEKHGRAIFMDSVAYYLNRYGFDGVELHWFYPGCIWRFGKPRDKENFVQLLKELRVAFKKRGWLLTIMVPAEPLIVYAGYDIKRINPLVHQMHVRTLDLRGNWTKTADNASPLYGKPGRTEPDVTGINVNDSLHLLVSLGASRRKLIPIFPAYGRSLTLRNENNFEPGAPLNDVKMGLGMPGKFTKTPGILANFELCEVLKHDFRLYFENATMTPYAVFGDQWIGYDDERSLRIKADFIIERGYGGAALFSVSMEDSKGTCGPPHEQMLKFRDFLS